MCHLVLRQVSRSKAQPHNAVGPTRRHLLAQRQSLPRFQPARLPVRHPELRLDAGCAVLLTPDRVRVIGEHRAYVAEYPELAEVEAAPFRDGPERVSPVGDFFNRAVEFLAAGHQICAKRR
jgi:hypothetical protein